MQMTNHSIRKAHEADFNTCVSIAHRAWPEFKERESIYHLFCKFFHDTCFICETPDAVVGFLLGFLSQVSPAQAYIHLVAVDPPARRNGYARELYKAFFADVEQRGVEEIRLIVNPDNNGSLLFHEQLGFTPELREPSIMIGSVQAVKDYNGPGLHMVPFRRGLNESSAKF
jgi:ribosomal protein S18 acetylase RimI-like enzyme